MNITLVLGTARTDNNSAAVAAVLRDRLETKEVALRYVAVGDIVTDAQTQASWEAEPSLAQQTWRDIVADTDTLVFVIPEYNHSFPGEWKLLIDMLAVKEYSGKRVFVASVSSGAFAGVRMMEQLLPVFVYLELHVQPVRLHVGSVGALVKNGILNDEQFDQRVEAFVTSIVS